MGNTIVPCILDLPWDEYRQVIMSVRKWPERQKLKQDAIRLRRELGWSERRIARHLTIDYRTIHRWLPHNGRHNMPHILSLNQVRGQKGVENLPQVKTRDKVAETIGLPPTMAELILKSLPANGNACKPILSVNSRHELMPTQEMNRYEN